MSKDKREAHSKMKQKLFKDLHLLTKLNYHTEALYTKHTILYQLFNPLNYVQTSFELRQYLQGCRRYFNMSNELGQMQIAEHIYKELQQMLGNKRTFCDTFNPNEERKEEAKQD